MWSQVSQSKHGCKAFKPQLVINIFATNYMIFISLIFFVISKVLVRFFTSFGG